MKLNIFSVWFIEKIQKCHSNQNLVLDVRWEQLSTKQQEELFRRDLRDRQKKKEKKCASILEELFADDEDEIDYDLCDSIGYTIIYLYSFYSTLE